MNNQSSTKTKNTTHHTTPHKTDTQKSKLSVAPIDNRHQGIKTRAPLYLCWEERGLRSSIARYSRTRGGRTEYEKRGKKKHRPQKGERSTKEDAKRGPTQTE